MPEYEDSSAGSTDISGAPPQVRTPASIAQSAAGRANQMKRGPQVDKSPPNPLQRAASAVGGALSGAAGAVGGASQRAADWERAQGFAQPPSATDFNPVDWAGEAAQDASALWGMARHAAGVLSGNYHDSVHSFFSHDDGQSKFGQQMAAALPALEGGLGLASEAFRATGQQEPGALAGAQELAGVPVPQPGESDKAYGEQALQSAPGLAENVGLSVLAPETFAGKVAMAGLPIGQSLLSLDPHESGAAWAWLGLAGGLLSVAHVPVPLRRILLQKFGDWPAIERLFGAGVQRRQDAAAAAMDSAKLDKAVNDHIAASVDTKQAPPDRRGIQNLVSRLPGESDFRDPADAVAQLPGGFHAAGNEHLGDLADLVSELHSGLWATSENPSEQILRAFAGHARSLDSAFERYFSSMSATLGDVSEDEQVAMGRAAEGDVDVYNALPPAQRLAVDSWRILAAAMREGSEETGQASNFLPNYMPRPDELSAERPQVGRPSRATLFSREDRARRATEESVDPFSGNVTLKQKYPTVQAANQALREARGHLVNQLLDPAQQLEKGLANNPEVDAIRQLAGTDIEAAKLRAIRLAGDHFPLKSERFLDNIGRLAPKQAKAILSQRALNELTQAVRVVTHPDGTTMARRLAQDTRQMTSRDIEERLRSGYTRIADPRFANYLFDRDVANILQRYTQLDLQLPGVLEKLSALNRQLLRLTMYSPAIHGANIARRLTGLAFNHPIEFARYISGHAALHPSQIDDVSRGLRREAYQSGLLPPRAAKSYQANFSDRVDNALGHGGDSFHFGDSSTRVGKMAQALTSPVRGYHGLESGFWRWVSDFGTLAYHVEKRALSAKGVDEATARAWAARRANSWMGMVLPEDVNPMTNKLSRLLIFAPAWWRSVGELLIPHYQRSGVWEDPRMARYAVTSALKTAAAMYGAMKLSTWSLNALLSGHGQDQNLPGHQDDVEIRNPAVLHILQSLGHLPQGMDPNTGVNPETGARMYIRVGGQTEDVLQALGFESGQAGTPVGPRVGPLQLSAPGSLQDSWDGLMHFLAARTSPLLNSASAVDNIDLYTSVTQMTPRAVVPGTTAGVPNPLSVAAATIMAAPGGADFMRSIDRTNTTQQPGQSLWGYTTPTSLQGALAAMPPSIGRAALTGLTGVNPPYPAAQRTRGTQLSDSEYQKVQQLTQDYNRERLASAAELFNGQMTPYQWRSQYLDAQHGHDAAMRALFHNAPEYVDGAQGMANQWEKLYAQATNPDGSINQAQLAELQAQFRARYSASQLSAMQAVLTKNDTTDPAKALYYKTLDAADQWEQEWAAQNGLDVSQLRRENTEYNALHGDNAAQTKYLRQHVDLERLRRAIQSQFYRTTAGMMYALYRGDNAAVMRMLKARNLSYQDLATNIESGAAAA